MNNIMSQAMADALAKLWDAAQAWAEASAAETDVAGQNLTTALSELNETSRAECAEYERIRTARARPDRQPQGLA